MAWAIVPLYPNELTHQRRHGRRASDVSRREPTRAQQRGDGRLAQVRVEDTELRVGRDKALLDRDQQRLQTHEARRRPGDRSCPSPSNVSRALVPLSRAARIATTPPRSDRPVPCRTVGLNVAQLALRAAGGGEARASCCAWPLGAVRLADLPSCRTAIPSRVAAPPYTTATTFVGIISAGPARAEPARSTPRRGRSRRRARQRCGSGRGRASTTPQT